GGPLRMRSRRVDAAVLSARPRCSAHPLPRPLPDGARQLMRRQTMSITTGILLFPDAEELDFAGPWEVLTMAAMIVPGDRVVTIAETAAPVRCAKGLRVLPDHVLTDAPALDVLLVPGGFGTEQAIVNAPLVEWVRSVGAQALWVTSVCSGAGLLHAAGFLRGKQAVTHWSYREALRGRGDVTVLEGPR